MSSKREADAPAFPEPGTSASDGEDEELSNVVYIGHIPHGFYERQMREYFGQFGRVTKIRMSRSKKTGASRHYAFLEFYSPEVAKIAADSMNGYIFFGRRLQCHLVPKAKVHPELWTGHDRRFRVVPWRRLERERRAEVEATEGHLATKAKRAAKRDRKRREKVQEAGIDYEWTGHADAKAKGKTKASKVVFE